MVSIQMEILKTKKGLKVDYSSVVDDVKKLYPNNKRVLKMLRANDPELLRKIESDTVESEPGERQTALATLDLKIENCIYY